MSKWKACQWLIVIGALLAMGSTAYAKDVRGDGGPNVIKGTSKADRLQGTVGNDLILGGSGRDTLLGGLGNDRIFGGAGRDRIFVADGGPDFVNCGPGKDTVHADKVDILKHCERVILVTIVPAPVPVPNPTPTAPPLPVPAAPPAAPVGAPSPANGQLGIGGPSDPSYAAYQSTYRDFAIPSLDWFWGQLMGNDANGAPRYVPLNAYEAVAPNTTITCDGVAPTIGGIQFPIGTPYNFVSNAQYCQPNLAAGQGFHDGSPTHDYVVWDDSFLFDIYQKDGDGAVVFTLAHEWGHAIAWRLGWVQYATVGKSLELNADCLGGAFEGYMVTNGYILPGIAQQVGALVAGLPPDDGSHGSVDERYAAINHGFASGADSCRDYLF